MTIRVICVRPREFKIFSWLIMLIQNTDYSHMGIQVGDVVLDATLHGVEFTDLRKFRSEYRIVKDFYIELPGVEKAHIYQWAWKYKDVLYSIMQNIGLGLKSLKVIKKNPFGGDDNRVVCSELVVLLLSFFLKLPINDSDSYDLVRAEKFAEEAKNASFIK